MSISVCGDPSAIDAEWMTQALEEAGVARGARITDPACVGSIGTGQMSRNCADESQWVTGQVLAVDGGLTVGRPWRTQPEWARERHAIRLYRPEGRWREFKRHTRAGRCDDVIGPHVGSSLQGRWRSAAMSDVARVGGESGLSRNAMEIVLRRVRASKRRSADLAAPRA